MRTLEPLERSSQFKPECDKNHWRKPGSKLLVVHVLNELVAPAADYRNYRLVIK